MTPLRLGFVWAALAAVTFGLTTPLVAHFTGGTGPWLTAGFLYLGAAMFALAAQRDTRALTAGFAGYWRVLIPIAVIGGMFAPAAYVVGVHASGAVAASLALNMEAPFSVAYAAIVFREFIGRRIIVAMLAIVAGASLMTFDHATPGVVNVGVIFVVIATALWAIDNGLSAKLSNIDARITVFWKSAIGTALSLLAGLALHESTGSSQTIVIIVAVGAIGYGASLVCYLIAQRHFGVARTASVFAAAPFIGALAAIAARDRGFGFMTGAAMLLMLAGVVLHATERHAHMHRHISEEHTHEHRHDDLHHSHVHELPVTGEHTHEHVHRQLVHAHEHASDAAHRHDH
jgi:drug/metabolite transporter (DMT)-like permease